MKMIDHLKLRTFSQNEISKLRSLNLLPDYPKQGRECFKLNDRIKLEFRPIEQQGERLGYSFADIVLFPHYLFNNGKHNGNDFAPDDCINILDEVFNALKIEINDLHEYQVINLEFGVNIIPDSDVKDVVKSIKYWKRKPFKRNKGDFSLITDSTAHKQIKAYAKGIDDLERLKTGEIPPNTFRWEIKSKERKFLKLTANDLFSYEVYNEFQKRLLNDLDLTLFIEQPKSKKSLNSKERAEIRTLSNFSNWKNYLNDENRDKFNYQRKKYEKICAKIPTLKAEVKTKINEKFNSWKNSANSTKKTLQKKQHNKLENNELNENYSANSTTRTHARAFYSWKMQN